MRAEFRFYAELKDFLPKQSREHGTITHSFLVPGSVKDAIESVGVPHTEVDLIIANGESVDFAYRVHDGDRVSVYPMFEALDVAPVVRLRAEPLRVPRFVVDDHLSKLASYLRLVGFDTLCDRGWSDHDLVRISTEQRRLLLTRDIGLLKHGALTHASYVRATDPREQLIEVVGRFQLAPRLEPFTRCMPCNGLVSDVAKAAVSHLIPAGTAAAHHEFRQCAGCSRVYWRGAHMGELEALVAEARGRSV